MDQDELERRIEAIEQRFAVLCDDVALALEYLELPKSAAGVRKLGEL